MSISLNSWLLALDLPSVICFLDVSSLSVVLSLNLCLPWCYLVNLSLSNVFSFSFIEQRRKHHVRKECGTLYKTLTLLQEIKVC